MTLITWHTQLNSHWVIALISCKSPRFCIFWLEDISDLIQLKINKDSTINKIRFIFHSFFLQGFMALNPWINYNGFNGYLYLKLDNPLSVNFITPNGEAKPRAYEITIYWSYFLMYTLIWICRSHRNTYIPLFFPIPRIRLFGVIYTYRLRRGGLGFAKSF